MQITGVELEVGHVFSTIDGLGGRVLRITAHKKGWREVIVEDEDGVIQITPFSIFDSETLDLISWPISTSFSPALSARPPTD